MSAQKLNRMTSLSKSGRIRFSWSIAFRRVTSQMQSESEVRMA